MKIELKTETKPSVDGLKTTYWTEIDGSYVDSSLSFSLEEAELIYESIKKAGGKKTAETLKSETI